MKIYPLEMASESFYNDAGKSRQSSYLYHYLLRIGVQTVVVEEGYIDKDYLIAYSFYHSRSFKPCPRETTRLHFFSKIFAEFDFDKVFDSDTAFINELKKTYLGFAVIRPNESSISQEKSIGRTAVGTYPLETETGDVRYYVDHDNSTSLYGIPLCIKSLPFQSQDSIVSACATTAIWVCLHALNHRFNVQVNSPYEITQKSVSFPGLSRNFPNIGLNTLQMKEYFNHIGLETEFIRIDGELENGKKFWTEDGKNKVSVAIKAYLSYDIPIVACIIIKKRDLQTEKLIDLYHAVTITGYRSDQNGNLTEIYVHDDQFGPYSHLFPRKEGDFTNLRNEWIDIDKGEEICLECLLIPLYPKIRLSFHSVYKLLLYFQKNDNLNNYRLYLTDINKYRHQLLSRNFVDKKNILLTPAPKYLWIFEVWNQKVGTADLVYDATSISVDKPFQAIKYS